MSNSTRPSRTTSRCARASLLPPPPPPPPPAAIAATAHSCAPQLRETIDNLRRERVVFDQIYKKLERELAEKRKEMASIIDAANEAYAARDQAQEEMQKLKERADEEQEQFEAEWKELGKLIEEDRKRKSDFMKKDRAGGGQEARGDMTLDQEHQLRKKVRDRCPRPSKPARPLASLI